MHEEDVQKRISRTIANPKLSRSSFFWRKSFPGKSRLYDFLSENHLIKGAEVVNDLYCEELMERGDYDVFQPTHYNSYFLGENRKPFVFIVHDIIPELFPQYYHSDFQDILEREKLIKVADQIVAISENTKKDIINRWNVPEDKITVIYWGAPEVNTSILKREVPDQYLLYVGDRNHIKDFLISLRK